MPILTYTLRISMRNESFRFGYYHHNIMYCFPEIFGVAVRKLKSGEIFSTKTATQPVKIVRCGACEPVKLTIIICVHVKLCVAICLLPVHSEQSLLIKICFHWENYELFGGRLER